MATIKVQVQVLKGPVFDVQLPSTSSLSDLRYRIHRETLVPPASQRLILNNAIVLPEDGALLDLGFADSSNLKMIVTGGIPAEYAQPPKPSDSEIGRLFQLGWGLIRTNAGRDKVDKIAKRPGTMLSELQGEPLAADMMKNPTFREMVSSQAFLNSLYYAVHNEELKPVEAQAAAPVVVRPPSPPRMSHEEALKTILDMGFSQETAEAALVANRDNLDQALQSLLG